MGELEGTVGEVAEIGKKLVVVSGNKVVPKEAGIGALRAAREQEVSPDLRWDARLHGIISKDTSVARLGELEGCTIIILLIIEVFSGRDVMELGPWLTRSNKS